MNDKPEDRQLGLIMGLSAFVMWGFLPLYFYVLDDVPPDMMLAHRAVYSMITGAGLILIGGNWRQMESLLADRRSMWLLLLSGTLIGGNWLIYIWAVQNDRVIEASLGYFINPLFNFLVGAVLFGERFSKLQLLAILLAALGVANQTLNVGQFPYVSIMLCLTFGFYGAIRKFVPVDSRVGFTMETTLLAPFALGYLVFQWSRGVQIYPDGTGHIVLLLMAGILTAAPLIFFALAARRLQLSTIGVMQYLGPTIQLLLGVFLFKEAFTTDHMITFGLIWAGVGLFNYSAWRAERRARIRPPGTVIPPKRTPPEHEAAAGIDKV